MTLLQVDLLAQTPDGPYKDHSDEQLDKAEKSYEKLIDEHNKKLDDFKNDPEGQSDPEKLKEVKEKSPENVDKFHKGREKSLEKQVKKQEGELDKIRQEKEKRSTGG